MKKKFLLLKNILIVFFAFIACFFILNIPEPTGLSDNGDFCRVIEPNNISFIDKTYSNLFFQNEYVMDISEGGFFDIIKTLLNENTNNNYDYTSSQFLFVKLSKVLNYIFNIILEKPLETYYIEFLAMIYILIFSFAFLLFIKAFKTEGKLKNLFIFIIFAFIFIDLSYIIYFNSFFGEGLQYCSFMLIVAILSYILQDFRKQKQLNNFKNFLLILFFIFAYIFSASKAANMPISIIFCIIGIIIALLNTKKFTKYLLVVIGILSISMSCYHLTQTPKWMNDVTNYHSVFFGILKNSNNIYSDLDFFNISKDYAYLANTTAYIGEYQDDIYTDKFYEEVYNNISKGKILSYYLLHPDRFIEKTILSLEYAHFIKPIYLGNYLNNDDHYKLEQNDNFSIWTKIRQSIDVTQPIFFLIICILLVTYIIGSIIKCFSKRKNFSIDIEYILHHSNLPTVALITTLTICLILSLVIPFMGNGEADLQKHMFLFNNIYDIILAFILVSFVTNIDKFIKFVKKITLFKQFAYLKIGIILLAVISISLITSSSDKIKELTFGKYNNKDIVWEIIDETDDTYLLITKEPIIQTSFDTENSNYWIDSSLRSFLNNDLYSSFSENEKERILLTNTTILLPETNVNLKESGTIPYYLNAFVQYQDMQIQNYYQTSCNDYIFLLNVFDYEKYIVNNSISTKNGMVFLTPYSNNSTMVRYINNDGYIFIKDACCIYSIYPCITIKKL